MVYRFSLRDTSNWIKANEEIQQITCRKIEAQLSQNSQQHACLIVGNAAPKEGGPRIMASWMARIALKRCKRTILNGLAGKKWA